MNSTNAKRKAVFDRIESIEQAIVKAREYLQYGKHADWHKFRFLFVRKTKKGEVLPPHRDLVENVFLMRMEKSLSRAESILERLDEQTAS